MTTGATQAALAFSAVLLITVTIRGIKLLRAERKGKYDAAQERIADEVLRDPEFSKGMWETRDSGGPKKIQRRPRV